MERHGDRRFLLLAAGLPLAFGLLHAAIYWPGIMIWDAIRQYGQALSGRYDDWHPPAFAWLWRQMLPLAPGPAPMLALQLLLYWGGHALLAGWAARQSRRGLALALAACGLFPLALALTGEVMKDALMAGALLSAAGLLAWRQATGGRWFRIGGIALLLFAATLRFNAVLACLPLLAAFLADRRRGGRGRLVLAAAAAAVLLLLALPLANLALRAQPSGVGLSLVIFDLGGITEQSGANAFPPLADVDDPVAINHGCYDPASWDRYAWWGEDPCEIGFETLSPVLTEGGRNPYRFWLAAIAAHPLAYAGHRLRHFNANSRFLVRNRLQRPAFAQSDPNPWNVRVRSNPALVAVDRIVLALDDTPLGWPIWWLAVAAGALILAPRLPSRGLVVPLAASSLFYGLGYAILSVASEMRYHLWTIVASLLAAAIAASEIRQAPLSRRRLAFAILPAFLVALAGFAWRMSA
jgi:hypothetical protein